MTTCRSPGKISVLFPLLTMAAAFVAPVAAFQKHAQQPEETGPGSGCLRIVPPEGEDVPAVCPLKHTEVTASIAGFIGRVTVKQTFTNPTARKIEAIYVFPLPQDSAVDQMTMLVGDKRIVAEIKEREEARRAYEQARAAGYVAGLLDQERPNIFTQSIANIEPGATVEIEISYVEMVKYEDGQFTWVFPMVVGPRYIPGGGSAQSPMTIGRNTPQAPDAGRITPPVTPQGTRAGHDIHITVQIDGGSPRMAPAQISSELHQIEREPTVAPGMARLHLKHKDEIPNRDFVLRYRLGDEKMGNAFLTHADTRGQYFALVLQPPQRVVPDAVVPRELIFVLDTSGSMQGYPIEKAKEVMDGAIAGLRSSDTFNLITFAGDTHVLWEAPRPASPENLREARAFLASRSGGGGTEMMKAIEAALVQKPVVRPIRRPRIELGNQAAPDAGDANTSGATANVLSPDALARRVPDGKEVTVQLHVDQVESWPAANVRSTWSGQAVRTANGIFEVSGAPVGQQKAGARFLAHGSWVWSQAMDHPVLEVERVEWIDSGNASLTPQDEIVEPSSIAPIRIVCFMTDGYVGNDQDIIAAVQRNAGTTRVFSFGIGNSVNRYLLDGMAREGRGEVEYVTLASQGEEAVKRFTERISAPVLTDIQLEWGGLAVSDVYPSRVPDLFSAKPVVVFGRLNGNVRGTVRLTGNTGTGPYESEIELGGQMIPQKHDSLASLWARSKVDALMAAGLRGEGAQVPEQTKRQVIELGLSYRLMTQFTSFVAVEEMRITSGGQPVTVRVPVEMPAGVSYEGVFGDQRGGGQLFSGKVAQAAAPRRLGAPLGIAGKPAPTAQGAPITRERLEAMDLEADVSFVERPAEKLADALRGLAEKVQREGRDGNLHVDGVEVRDWRIDVIVQFASISDSLRERLKRLGFTEAGAAVGAKVLIGSIDVRKLEELSKMEAVLSIRPVK